MARRYRTAGLVLIVGLASILGYAGYSMQAHASSNRSIYGGYGSPQTTNSSSPMGAEMVMGRSAQSTRTVTLKHRRTVRVTIQSLAFGPAHVVVSPGTKIIWTNHDSFQHTTTSDRQLWDSGPINSGARFERLFKKAGSFSYYCTIHPFMHGTITVSK